MTLPSIAAPGGVYGWVWHEPASPQGLQLDSRLSLTLAGLMHVPDARDEVAAFLDLLALMIGKERSFVPSPAVAEEAKLTSGEVGFTLSQMGGEWSLDENALEALREMCTREPATWHCQTSGGVGRWELRLSPFLRGYGGLTTPREYVERVVELSTPARPEPEPLYPSSLSLPEAIDYLNAIWWRHSGEPLMRIGRAEAAAKLVLDCATGDEFESRVSALCTILGALNLPGAKDGALNALEARLRKDLGEESAGRAVESIGDLRAIVDLRVWRQHVGTERRAARGLRRLGIQEPVTDWAGTWQLVQARAVAALSTLREEVETLL